MSSPAQGQEAHDEARPQREVAQRVFAGEFNEARHSFKESGERSPTFVVSPYGAKINRLFGVGVLTNVEPIGQQPGNYRAQIVDPTGTFYLLSGQYEPEATAQLAELRPPEIVAFVGKSRSREFEGTTYVNVRPERLHVVTKAERDAWIIEAAKLSMTRVEAMREALKMETPTQKALEDLGYSADVSEGVVKALEHYGKPELAKQINVIRDAVESLLPGAQTAQQLRDAPTFSTPTMPAAPTTPVASTMAKLAPPSATPPKAAAPAKGAPNPHEELILGLCTSMDDGKGAPWEDIVGEAAKKNVSEAQVEECLNVLMDKGLVYEPVLGRLKRT